MRLSVCIVASMSDEPLILPLRAMARSIGVTQRWLREQSDAALIPHLRAGRRYLYAPAAVESAVAELAQTTPGDRPPKQKKKPGPVPPAGSQ